MAMNPRLLRPRQGGDPDALRYIAAVQQADGATLEPAVRKAINDFVIGCKADGIWSAIKASCILAGARTLAGALTPLVGAAPTNVNNNFVAGDYDRKTGLVGNGISKNLDSGRDNNADGTNDKHVAVWQAAHQSRTSTRYVLGSGSTATGESQLGTTASARLFRVNYTAAATAQIAETATTAGLFGAARNSASNLEARFGGTTTTLNDSSTAATNARIFVFSRQAALYSDARIAFYSIGSYLNLSLLDSRVTALINAIGAAIP